jgi:hypothetical protein
MYHAQARHLRFPELSSRINARARLPSATARAMGKVTTFRRSCVESRTILATFNSGYGGSPEMHMGRHYVQYSSIALITVATRSKA